MFAMVFDVVSFLAGIGAGALMGALAGVLHGLEKTADIQERLRLATKIVEDMSARFPISNAGDSTQKDAKAEVDDLQGELDEIGEEIKRMYKRTAR